MQIIQVFPSHLFFWEDPDHYPAVYRFSVGLRSVFIDFVVCFCILSCEMAIKKVWLDRGACITRGKVPVFFCERKLLKCRTTLDIFLKRCVVVSCLLNLAFFFYLLQIHFVPVYTSLNHQQPAWKTALKLPCDEQTHITLALKKTKNLQLQRKIRLIQLTFFKIHFAIELLFMKTQRPSWLADDFHLASELAYLWNQGYILYLL